jgi:phosphotransferase system HPr (HPr) family protein
MTKTRSRETVIREREFARLLAEESAMFGGWLATILEQPDLLESGPVVLGLQRHASALESFLDDFGARQNRAYVTLGEMVASVRGIASVASNGLHLKSRLPRFPKLIDEAPLGEDLDRSSAALADALIQLLGATRGEAERCGCEWSPLEIDEPDGPVQRRLLPRNLDEDETVDERQHIAEIGAKYLKVLDTSRNLELGFVRPKESLAQFVQEHATEELCRWYESTVHSIQSMYDTYVLNTSVERDHPWLQSLRGHVSVSLRLLQMATALVHFYERHENDIRHEPARQAVSAVVPKQVILDVAVNICLRHAYLYVEGASATAHQILKTFVRQASTTLSMPEGVTLHARPLALIVQVARHYGTPMEISFDGERCSASSLMSLILLGGRHPRPTSIKVEGDSRALRDLELLFESGLGESGNALPPGLDYLRVGT